MQLNLSPINVMRRVLFLVLIQLIGLSLLAQQPHRFEKEVQELIAGDSLVSKKKLILFTGSSSIRMWKDLKTDFPGSNVLNHGFGGSDMADLLHYATPLIINSKPSRIFIYEGDNDINAGRTPDEIIADAEKLLALLRASLPGRVRILFISPKPSVARWHLKDKYIAFNSQLKHWTSTKKNVFYVDVWTPMLDEKGEVRKNLFVEDNLHMNREGYDIWKKAIGPYLK
jgi:lysophospholipase L1-like esterase